MSGSDQPPEEGDLSADGGASHTETPAGHIFPDHRDDSVDTAKLPAAQAESSASLYEQASARLARSLSLDAFPLSLLPTGLADQRDGDVPLDLFAAQAFVLGGVLAVIIGIVALGTGFALGLSPVWSVVTAAALSVTTGIAVAAVRFGGKLLDAQGEEKEIEAALPGAVAYMYSQAAANTNIYTIIGSIARAEDAYGPVAREFQSVVRRCEYFGYELEQALSQQAESTASEELGRLMVDMVTFLDSGGDVTEFFSREMDRAFEELESQQQERIDYLDVLSTLYVPVSIVPILGVIIIVALSSFRPIPTQTIVILGYFVTPSFPLIFLILTDLVQPHEAEGSMLSVSAAERDVYSGTVLHGNQNVGRRDTEQEAAEADSSQRTSTGVFGGGRAVQQTQTERPDNPLHPADPGFTDTPTADSLADSSPAFESVPSMERWGRIRAVFSDPIEYFRLNPEHTLVGSIPLTLAVMSVLFALGIATVPTIDKAIAAPLATTTIWVTLPSIVTLGPLIVAHEYDIRKREALFAQYPEMLQKISAANDTGMTLLESLREASSGGDTQIDREMRIVEQKVAMGIPLETALAEFANAYSDPQISRSTRLVIEAQRASERVSNVLEIAIEAALSRVQLRETQKSSTKSYVVMIALTTLVAIGATAALNRVLNTLLTGAILSGVGSSGVGQSSISGSGSLNPEIIKVILYHLSMIYAASGGLFAGYIGSTEFKSGIKFSLAGMIVATVIWWVALGGGGLL
jgi:flagellar protein FlaJ